MMTRKTKRRLAYLFSPRWWSVVSHSLFTVFGLVGLRETTPLEKVAGPWEKERGRFSQVTELEGGDISLPRWVGGWPCFFYPLFPKVCLRRSLVLYRHLVRLGHDPELVVGVKKRGADLDGHAWVELAGEVLGEVQEAVQEFNPILVLRRGKTGPVA